jgi:hypothetical protein
MLGVNYWPRRKAMYWWADFDVGEVREEFAMIRELGLTHVRLFLLWESFQPSPDGVSARAVGDLRAVCDVAAERGCGCSRRSSPGTCRAELGAGVADRSATPRPPDERQLVSLRGRGLAQRDAQPVHHAWVIAAEDLLLRTVCGELRDHPAVWGYSLGNEPDLFCSPPTPRRGGRGCATGCGRSRAADPDRPRCSAFTRKASTRTGPFASTTSRPRRTSP